MSGRTVGGAELAVISPSPSFAKGLPDLKAEHRSRRWKRLWGPLVVVGVLAVAGGVLLANMIPHGIGLSSDSLLYVMGAESLRSGAGWTQLSGEGTREAIAHFPPLYSWLLAAVAGPTGGVLDAASRVSILLFGGVIAATGAALTTLEDDPVAGVVAALLLAVSPILISVYSWAMSETLFLLLGLASLAFLAMGLGRAGIGWLILAGLAAGLAYLARYVGMALILTGGIVLALRSGMSRKERTIAIAAFAGPAFLGVGAWSVRNLLLTGTTTNRTLTWHALSTTKWKSPLALIWAWLFPSEFDAAALRLTAATLVVVALAGAILVARHRLHVRQTINTWRRSPSFSVLNATYAVVYAGLVGFSLMFADAATPVDLRIAAPVYLCSIVAVSAVWATGYRRRPTVWARPILLLAVAALGGSYGLRSWRLGSEIRGDGQGFASSGWRDSSLMAAANRLPPDALVYSDNREVYTFFTGVGAYGLPAERDSVTGRINPETPAILEQILERLQESGGVVVLFGSGDSDLERAYLAPLLTRLNLVVSASDGQIYDAPRTD